MLVRVVTDIVWMSHSSTHNWTASMAARIYYVLLIAFTAWGLLAVNWGDAMSLFKVLGNVAGLVLAVSAVQVFLVCHKFLPKELQPSPLRKALLLSTTLFYGLFSMALLIKLI